MIGLGGTSTLGIGLIIELRDKFSQNANKISDSLNSLHGNANKAMKNSFNTMIGVGTAMTAVGAGITMGMRASVQESMKFQQVLTNVKALGEMTNAEITELGKVAQTLGPKYGRDAITVAKGMEDLVKAGLKGKEIPKVMEAILQTATASGDALEGEGGVAARMTDIMMAWGMSSNQAMRAGDIMAKASIESTVSFNDLAESMKYSQDIMKGLHMTFEESVAMMGVLGNAGIKASMSGTALGNAWREMAIALGGTSKKKTNALKDLGLGREDLMDAYGNLKRPVEILDKLKEGIAGMGDVQRQNVLNDLFGVRGKRGINPLLDFLSKGPNDKWMGKSFKDMVSELTNNSAGANLKIIEEKSKGAAYQAKVLKANWENFKIAIGNAVLPALTKILPIITKIVEKLTAFANTGFGKFLIIAIGLVGALLIPLGAIITLTGLIGRGMMSLTGGFAAFRTAGAWAYNTLIAKALQYIGVMKGVQAGQRMNAAGSIIDSATGRIVTPAYKVKGGAGASAGAAAASGGIKAGLKGMASSGLVGGLLGGALEGIMGGSGSDIWNGIKTGLISGGLMSLVNSLLTGGTTLASLFTTISGALSSFLSFLGISTAGLGAFAGTIAAPAAIVGGLAYSAFAKPEFYDQSRSDYTRGKSFYKPNIPMDKKGDTIVNIHVDGEKTISKRINENTENEIYNKYGYGQ